MMHSALFSPLTISAGNYLNYFNKPPECFQHSPIATHFAANVCILELY